MTSTQDPLWTLLKFGLLVLVGAGLLGYFFF